ncbi:MAG TPA: hypothetical protein VF677_03650 [Flavobacterium sp.]|jgi:hypothetical protein
MKNLIYIILLININCNGQTYQSQKNKNKMNQLVINKDFERFDVKQLLTNGNQKKGSSEKGEYLSYEYVSQTGANTTYMYGIKNDIYISTLFIKNSVYAVKKIFHGNGTIKEKGVFFNGNDYTKLGMWYKFDENGKLIEKINYDEGYKFSFEDVLHYCNKNKINVELGDARKFEGGFHTQILKEEKNGLKVWVIQYQDHTKPIVGNISKDGMNYEYNIFEEIILEGMTGKILSKNRIDMGNANNLDEENSFLAEHYEKGTYEKPQLGTPYTSPSELSMDKDIYQVYKGRYYTKAEWKEFHKSLPWWERLI